MKAVKKMNDDERKAHLDSMTKKYSEYGLTFIDVDTSQKTRIRYIYIVNGNRHVNTENEITWMLGIWKNKRKSFEMSKKEVYGYWRNNHDLLQIAYELGRVTTEIVEEVTGSKPQGIGQIHEQTAVSGPKNDIEESYDIAPEFIPETEEYNEGSMMQVWVNRYERNHQARKKCISLKGCCCAVCGMDFGRIYGTIGEGFIHVHHTIPISSIGKNYVIDYANDLVPVCPNCHAMLHKKNPPYTVAEMKELLTNKY